MNLWRPWLRVFPNIEENRQAQQLPFGAGSSRSTNGGIESVARPSVVFRFEIESIETKMHQSKNEIYTLLSSSFFQLCLAC